MEAQSSLTKSRDAFIRMLNITQNTCLRCILGARRTTPILSLEAETGIPPLHIYLKYTAAKKLMKVMHRNENDITMKELKYDINLNKSSLDDTLIFLRELGFAQIATRKNPTISQIPPWIVLEDHIYDITNDIVCEKDLKEYLYENFKNYEELYSDGSKITFPEISTATGLYIAKNSIAISWKLHPEHTVVSAELYGILKALDYIKENNFGNCIVFTDSLTALQIIKEAKLTTYKEITETIKILLMDLNKERKVTLHWIRGHTAIKGNIIADKVANLGHQNMNIEPYSINLDEVLSKLKLSTKTHWNTYWKREIENTQKGTHLLKIRKDIFRKSPVELNDRKLETAINRFRLGHVGVNKHLHRFNLAETPLCTTCQSEDSIEHFLMYCEDYIDQRGRLLVRLFKVLGHIPKISVELLLGAKEEYTQEENKMIIKNVAQFLLDTGKINKF